MVTRWRVCWLSAAILLSLTALVSGQCPAPMLNKFSYGDIQPDVSGSLFSVGSVLKVQCVPGFKSIGFTTFNCQSNGKWSPVAFPTCSGKRMLDWIYSTFYIHVHTQQRRK
eukprot:scpid105849/ scgid1303/ 